MCHEINYDYGAESLAECHGFFITGKIIQSGPGDRLSRSH